MYPLVWLGHWSIQVYTYVGYAFAVRFNSPFLVYVVMLAVSSGLLMGYLQNLKSSPIVSPIVP